MNEFTFAIAKVNYQRFLKSPWIWFSGIWLFIMLIATMMIRFEFGDENNPSGYTWFIFMWAACLIMYGATFWQYAWAMGNVDARGFHTEANKVDRHFISFMSTLPLDRGAHFIIQMSMYILTSLGICLLSFIFHILLTPSGESMSMVIYGHILLFVAFIYEGSHQVFIDLPAALQGEIRSLRHPAVIRSMTRFVVIVTLLWLLRQLLDQYPDEHPMELMLSYIASNSWVMLLVLVISILQYWRGFVTFKNIDIV